MNPVDAINRPLLLCLRVSKKNQILDWQQSRCVNPYKLFQVRIAFVLHFGMNTYF